MEISLFLCGGASKQDAELRATLGARLAGKKSKYTYVVHYPETMFAELILGHKRRNLLELENLLAESVSAVIIPLQSPGTFTELGAFSNHPRLCDKLVVIIDPKYRFVKSFINTGPIRHLRTQTKSLILYQPISISTVDDLSKIVADASRTIAARNPIEPSLLNPLNAKDFFFILATVLEPLTRKAAIEIAEVLSPSDKCKAALVADSVLDILVNERLIFTKAGKYYVPPRSVEQMVSAIPTEKRRIETRQLIWSLRIKAMNCIYRRKSVAWS